MKQKVNKRKEASSKDAQPPEALDIDQLLDFDVEAAELPAEAPKKPKKVTDKRTDEAWPGKPSKVKRARAVAASEQPAAKKLKAGKGKKAAASTDGTEQLQTAVKQHQAELEFLAEQDPEFYAYLKETDEDLLAFGSDSDDAGPSDGDLSDAIDSDEELEPEANAATPASAPLPLTAKDLIADGLGITKAIAEATCEAAKKNASVGSVHQLLRLYRAACHYSDSEHETEATLQITSSAAFNKIMLFTLREADGLLRRMLGNTDMAEDKVTDVTRQPRWRKVEPLAKSFLGNTLHILVNMTNTSMQAFILRRLRASASFLRPFEKLTRKLLKQAMELFGAGDNAVRVQAILFIRQLAIVLPQPALDMCLKGVCRTFTANAKFSNPASAAHLSFMATCIVELFGLDEGAAYAHAFTAIKNLAVTLRGALSMKTADAFRAVYCWQTVRCLELWARVLAEHANTELRALVYPLVQVLLGAARLVPSPRYFPLRLRLARALHRLAAAAGVLVPLSPLLLEMLHWSDLSKSPQAATGQAPDLDLTLRVSKSHLRTTAFQEELIAQVLQLLAEHLSQWACHVAFPELAHLTTTQLKALSKSLPAERFRTQAKALIAAVERNSAFVGRARDQATFSPCDLKEIDNFLAAEKAARKAPMQQYADVLTERAQQRAQLCATQRVRVPGSSAAQQSTDDSDDADASPRQQQQQRALLAAGGGKQRRAVASETAEQAAGVTRSLDQMEADSELLQDYVLSSDDEAAPSGSRTGRSAFQSAFQTEDEGLKGDSEFDESESDDDKQKPRQTQQKAAPARPRGGKKHGKKGKVSGSKKLRPFPRPK